jgi:hypothetical protein
MLSILICLLARVHFFGTAPILSLRKGEEALNFTVNGARLGEVYPSIFLKNSSDFTIILARILLRINKQIKRSVYFGY